MRSIILCLVFRDPSLEVLVEEVFTSQKGTKEQVLECKSRQRIKTLRLNCVSRLCRRDHDLSVCSRFKAKSPEEKLGFVSAKYLCFCCFDGGHFASHC